MDLLDFYDEKVDQSVLERQAKAAAAESETIKSNSKLDVFKDVLPSLMQTKQHILEDEKDYVPFMVNRMMSYYDDCLYYANEMNMNHQLPKLMQYDFYLHSIRAKKRFSLWIKPAKVADLDAVKTYYGFSTTKALDAINTLTEEQLVIIRKATTIG